MDIQEASDSLTYFTMRPDEPVSRERYVELLRFAELITGVPIYQLNRRALQHYKDRRAKLKSVR